MDPCLLACARLASSSVVLFRTPYLGVLPPIVYWVTSYQLI